MLKPLIFATVCAAAAPAAAGAAALPQAYSDFSFESVGYDVDTYVETHYAAGDYDSPTTVADPYLTMTAGPVPTPFVAVEAHGAGGVYAEGGGYTGYFFSVAGPAPVVVPLSAHVIIDATVGRGGTNNIVDAGGEVDIDTDLGAVPTLTASAVLGGSGDPTTWTPHSRVDEWVPFSLTAGSDQQNSIVIYGGASVEAGRGSGYANVFVDPVVVIDPAWAKANPGYSLGFSAGIGNSPGAGGVPEPASWALLVAGFGVAGALSRRRRAVVAA